MVTVFFKEQPPVVVKEATQINNADFWFRLSARDYNEVAAFKTADVIGYMIERGDGTEAD